MGHLLKDSNVSTRQTLPPELLYSFCTHSNPYETIPHAHGAAVGVPIDGISTSPV